ncbi:MAG: exo-alpha-sialidase, partial [Treponema sp.]|nr:exo-alpha-sialidase [Treponema sp.]
MKNAKLTGLFAKNSKLSLCLLAGFLAAFLLVGCFNPITAIPPKSGNSVTNPFTVDIFIGKDGSARSVAGPDSAQIKGNIRNFMQLIVVDDTGNIVAYAEDRRLNEEDTEGVLSINSIAFGQNYRFLLLMGHWEHENYNYYDGTNDFRPPTLLAAGLKTQQVFGSETITVVMWPIVVDTVFSANDRNLTVAPVITNGNPVAVTLYPIDWDVLWTINRGATGNGFTDLIGRTTPLSNPDASLTGKIITQPIGTYTSGFTKIGTVGSVNFKLEYKPFTTDAWSTVNNNNIKSDFFNLIEGGPVWIIRNGVNDEPQNESTNFTRFGNEVNYNGNGAVRFVIAPKTPDDGSELEISNGVFVGPSTSTTPDITFTTDGYEDSAEVYYAVVEKGHTPDYSDYKPLGEDNTVEEGDHRETIELDTANGDYDVYVIIYKDGEVSDPIIINTKEGGLDTDYEWGIGRFIAVAYDSDNAAWSGDGGKTWTNAPMPRLANWRSVTYGDGVFVALSCTVDYYAVARSEDNGETWQEIYLPTLLPIP